MIFTVQPKVYPIHYIFMLGEWNAEYVKKNFDDKVVAPTPHDGGACYDNNQKVLIWLEKVPTDDQGIGMLAHECLHAVIHSAKYIGITLHDSSDEFYCYMLQWLLLSALTKTKQLTNG